ncbi:hypothetical protein ACHHYP_01987 [Achlya hypogyna]|uniref:Transmembrane protein n=1 Tax=Achlya hypogyna TaxID=1202772 RepID=A0A1V9Z7Q3_ACHHY|nr:hypothetical protein ACHHYP_01987 [Achlya hypogyna]
MVREAYLAALDGLAGVKEKHEWLGRGKWIYRKILTAIGFCVVPLIAGDALINNWAVNMYFGEAYFFMTPIAAVQNAVQLETQYNFAKGLSISNLSNLGQWIANFTVVSMITKSDHVYLASIGDLPLTSATNLCPIFAQNYSVDASNGTTLRLALASDSVTFYKGNALSRFFGDVGTTNLGNSSMKSSQLKALGYVPGRTATDLRFTNNVVLKNTSLPQNQLVNYYRIFPRSYCSGCIPCAELGYGVCNFTMKYEDKTKTLTVTSSTFVPGSVYSLGLLMEHSAFDDLSVYAKLVAIAFAIGGYLASLRTVQWLEVDPTKVDSIFSRVVRTVVPKYFPYPSNALNYATFCYNSDIFVFLYAASVLFDMQTSLIYVREINLYNNLSPQYDFTLQMYSLCSRLLWVNCAILKLIKIVWNLLGTASYNGQSRVMGFFNLSSVTSLYLSAILLFYVPAFVEYNNGLTASVKHVNENIDGLRVRVLDGFYMRVFSSIFVGLIANIVLVTAVDRVWNYRYWSLLAENSLARQAMFNSSSIVCDFVEGIAADTDSRGSVLLCRARRLSTLQWFFMSHLTCFGLPEKELRAKKMSITLVQSSSKPHNASPAVSSSRTNSITYPTPITLPPMQPPSATNDDAFMVVQDGDRNIHLLDAQLNDVTSLVYNIKVLKNTTAVEGTMGVADVVARVKTKSEWSNVPQRMHDTLVTGAGVFVVIMIICDIFVNNWSINNFLGNGYYFVTPLAATQSALQLESQYSFAKGFSITNLSNTGQYMANYTVLNLVQKTDAIYVISAGAYPLTPSTTLCPIFQKSYNVDLSMSSNVRLALASDGVVFYRGNALTHVFSNDDVDDLATPSMHTPELLNLGYNPGRSDVDMRFTHEIQLQNSTNPQTQLVTYYRIFPRNFCSGCDPVAELGYSVCNMTLVYNDSTRSVTVTKSAFVPGSTFSLGLVLTNSAFGKIALYAKLLAIFFAIGGYLASRRTVQWKEVDPTKGDSIIDRVLRTVMPKYFPHASHALRFDMFLFNSDLFVFLYALSVILDIQSCLIFVRNVNLYNSLAPQGMYSLQMFSLGARFLWINCAILKGFKIVWNLLGTASYNGQSRIMGFTNLTNVLSVYGSAIVLFYIPAFIEYNNSVTISIKNSFEKIDGVRADVFNGFYMRVATSIAVGLIMNVFLITALDQFAYRKRWRLVVKNSLARQAIFNSSSILCDFLNDIEKDADLKSEASILICRARRLSTLQWFFMSHLVCFGLPERELRMKKQSLINVQSRMTQKTNATCSVIQSDVVSTHQSATNVASNLSPDDVRDSSYMVVQDGDANVHLLDGQLSDVTSLVYNIKVLKNSTVRDAVIASGTVLTKYIVRLTALFVVLLITSDALVNNWALSNYLGSGHFFMTPIADAQSIADLEAQYSHQHGLAISDLSNVGKWMANYTITKMVHKNFGLYTIQAGEFKLTPHSVLCPVFQGTYSVAGPTKIKLALAKDAVSFFRGHAYSHFVEEDDKYNLATATMKSHELLALGYKPGRTTVDERYTHVFDVANTSQPQTLLLSYFRIFSRNFCSGCDPVAELGFSKCNMTMVYDDATKMLTVTQSAFAEGTTYKLGFTMTNGWMSLTANYAKVVAVFLGVGGYLASRRTVQWLDADPTKPITFFDKALRIVSPKYFPYASYALSYDMFCYNSDIFVFLYALSVLLDLQNGLLYIRNVNLYNSLAPQALVSLGMFSISSRLLWVNCSIFKLFKLIWNLLGLASYNGGSVVMSCFNLSSVIWLYLSAVLLFYIPPFIEYNNKVTVDVPNYVDALDGICVEVLDGAYMRVAPDIIYGLFINLLVVTVADHVVNYKYWKMLARNSLARQAVYNSTSILCDYLPPVTLRNGDVVLACRARRLSTLQWYFMSHLTCFGLPEKDLSAKKRVKAVAQNKSARKPTTSSDSNSTTVSTREVPADTSNVTDDACMVVQDGDRVVHVLDARLVDMASIALNVKVLKDASITINSLSFLQMKSPTLAVVPVVLRRGWRGFVRRSYEKLLSLAGFCVVLLIAGDATANNWAIANFLGGGFFFITPIASVQSLSQLSTKYAFARNLGVENLSNMGQWMSNFSVTHMVAKSNVIYILNTGDIPLTTNSVMCPIFQNTYPMDISASPKVKLAFALDAVTHFRGNAVSHVFTNDRTANLGKAGMSSKELIALDYIPGRTTVDKRFTTEIVIANTSQPQTQVVNYYRIFTRAFCTGCDPVAELGYSECNFTMVYNDTAKTLTVTKSAFVPGSIYKLGFIMPNSAFGQVALAAKITAIAFAVFGYLASRRTVQWADIDPNVPESLVVKVMRMVLPKLFPHRSMALRYDMFCYNSDIFVFLYAISVLIDIPNCLLYVRNVNLYNTYAPQFVFTLQLFSLSTRLLWVNCAILKLSKLLWNLLGITSYNGESYVMGFFNLSSVTTLYMSAVLLFYVPPFIEFNNSITIDVKNPVHPIDGICVHVFDGFYMRVASSITVGLIANIFAFTALDHIVNFRYWRLMAKNSLARQAIYNSTSIVCDYINDVEADGDGATLVCAARRLTTLQWFFTCHLTCFGLPEKNLRAHKQKAVTVTPKVPTLFMNRNSAQRGNTSTRENESSIPAIPVIPEGATDSASLIVQDSDRNMHLLDANLTPVTSLALNIKILKNTAITIK